MARADKGMGYFVKNGVEDLFGAVALDKVDRKLNGLSVIDA
jgi:hypothetical protein